MPFVIQGSESTQVPEVRAPEQSKPKGKVVKEEIVEEGGERVRIVYTKPPISEAKKKHMERMQLARKSNAAKTRDASKTIRELEDEVKKLKGAGAEQWNIPAVQPAPVDMSAEIDRRVTEAIAQQRAEQNKRAASEVDVEVLVAQKLAQAMASNETSVRANHRVEKAPKPVKVQEEPDISSIVPIALPSSRFSQPTRPVGRVFG